MDRGIKDEGFVRRALREADSNMGRWIANQGSFNFSDSHSLDEVTRAAVITAVAVFKEKYDQVNEQDLEAACGIKTGSDARKVIDSIFAKLPASEAH
jgi:hypothetical protein